MSLARPLANLPASGSVGDAGLRVRVRPGFPLVVKVCGELGLQDVLTAEQQAPQTRRTRG